MHSQRPLPSSIALILSSIIGLWTISATAQSPHASDEGELSELVRQIEELRDEVNELRQLPRLSSDSLKVVGQSPYRLSSLKFCKSACDCMNCEGPLLEAPCIDCPRASLLNPYFNMHLFGALKLDMLLSARRPISPGTPFYLLPDATAGFDENTFDMHARQSTLGAALTGPEFGGFQSGGMFLATFYNDAIVVDQYGFLPLQAYGELRNDRWRIAAGLLFDVFNPGSPTVLPFSVLNASGNAGNAFRGQLRVERYWRPTSKRQWTLQLALSEPIASTIDPDFRISEDNGWPNIEARVALGVGCSDGADASRPFELGVSALVGQIRTTIPTVRQVVADVWGLGIDLRWQINDRFGIGGEFFTGQTLGTYNGGVLQNVNTVTRAGIRSSGGWLEGSCQWTSALHSHVGYGIDDPIDRDVAASGRLRNETWFANLLWDVNATFRVGFELAYRETAYHSLPDNDGGGFHTQFQWLF